MRKLMLTGLLLGALAGPAQADPLDRAVQDDRACVQNYANRRLVFLWAAESLPANWLRVNIQYQDVRRHRWQPYDACVDAARRRGLHVQLTLTGPGIAWSPEEFGEFAAKVSQHFRTRVERYSLFNEPNYGGNLPPTVRDSKTATYRAIYRDGYDAVHQEDPTAQVLLGETAAGPNAAAFLRRLLCLAPDQNPAKCAPIKADGIAHHPYGPFTQSPRQESRRPDKLGISSLDELRSIIAEACRKGTLVDPGGDCDEVYLTEFAYFVDGRGNSRKRNVKEYQRAAWTVDAWEVACHTDGVKEMLYYQLTPSPPKKHWSGDWDTSILDANGQPTLTYLALHSWLLSHPECLADQPTLLIRSPLM